MLPHTTYHDGCQGSPGSLSPGVPARRYRRGVPSAVRGMGRPGRTYRIPVLPRSADPDLPADGAAMFA